ncbi:DUF1002 domain-containing protein [Anaerosacchariphilus polymeriproducens]|uniref:DUF1002 domain-containing protein n=2 Tax=Anaerosacchariphilus polymeriproducens TaxID=1812858 RepID=A0A371B095_9FIRM|nr:DUF1002 domain-containing protein [Anaerosacchariphilus polymeriproducens]
MLLMCGTTAFADAPDVTIKKDDKPYLALGKDLTEEQKDKVLSLMGLTDTDLKNYDVVYVTNKEEYDYLGSYLDSSVIGDKALSSVLVVQREAGNGIKVTTKNISYCTTGMYRNALITAGITDADIIVAGPFKLSGTAALVGATKAYEEMTGENISKSNVDAATNELVVTGELAETVGDNEKAEELIAYVKQAVAANKDISKDEILEAIDEGSKTLDIELTEDDKAQIVSLMDKINQLDIDVDALKEQAKSLYDKLGDLNLDTDKLKESMGGTLSKVFTAIVEFIKGLFD